MRLCRKCGETKPLDEFYKRATETWCKACKRKNYRDNAEREKERSKLWHLALRLDVITAYGGVCACCGETEMAFLSIDHIDGGGTQHRRAVGGSNGLYSFLRKNGYPEGFQVLCHNCNFAKHTQGVCPHQVARLEAV